MPIASSPGRCTPTRTLTWLRRRPLGALRAMFQAHDAFKRLTDASQELKEGLVRL